MRKSVFDRVCAFGIAYTRDYTYYLQQVGLSNLIFRQAVDSFVPELVPLTGEEVE